MCNPGKKTDYAYVSADTIKKACAGDDKALGEIILRYTNYARKCFRTIAITKYCLDIKSVPMDDLMQLVWMRFVKVIVKKFKV